MRARRTNHPPPTTPTATAPTPPHYQLTSLIMPVVYYGGGRPVAGFQSGIALRWNAERGFGFIKPDQGDEDVFCHVSAINGGNALKEGAPCEFKVQYDDRRSKHRAAEVSGEAVTSDVVDARRGGGGRGGGGRGRPDVGPWSWMVCDGLFCRCGERPGECENNAGTFQLQTKPLGGGHERFIGLDIGISPDIILHTDAVIWRDSSGQVQTRALTSAGVSVLVCFKPGQVWFWPGVLAGAERMMD